MRGGEDEEGGEEWDKVTREVGKRRPVAVN